MRQLFIIHFSIAAFTVFGQKEAKVFTSDIDHFWQAYDSVNTTKDTLKQLEFIQTLYLDKASNGLKEFMEAREHSAKRHLDNIIRYPKFWTSVRPHTLNINSHKTEIEKVMLDFKAMYPAFKQPEVYFTIGVLNSGGTTTKDKILIGSEIATANSMVDASELGSWLQEVFKDNKNVVYLVAHEAVHTQQKETGSGTAKDPPTLLEYCIAEGSCDFIAEVLLKEPIVSPYMTYGKANEHDLWEAFQKEMYGGEYRNWLYNGADAPGGHADLGYFMGYAICKAYYEKSTDKQKAFKEIIDLDYTKKDLQKFLETSGYHGGDKQINRS